MRVLDIGCGTGGSAFYLARRFQVKVLGVDLSANMLAIAEEHRLEMEPEVIKNNSNSLFFRIIRKKYIFIKLIFDNDFSKLAFKIMKNVTQNWL